LETLIDDLADVMKERELVDEKEVVDLETGFVLGTSLRPRLDHSLLRARNRS
jgi:chaperonin cofactor prefoldin